MTTIAPEVEVMYISTIGRIYDVKNNFIFLKQKKIVMLTYIYSYTKYITRTLYIIRLF